jgi:hypothetical protein
VPECGRKRRNPETKTSQSFAGYGEVMRITVNPSFEWNGERYVLSSFEDQYEYDGPVVMCGGGPSDEEKKAAAAQLSTANTLNSIAGSNNAQQQEIFKTIKPFGTSRMNGGLPFFSALTDFASGTNARAFAPAKANLNRGLQQAHASPMARLQANTDFDMQRARGFDSALTSNLFANEQAKQQGAQILSGQAGQLNPLGYYQATQQGYNPQQYSGLRSPGMGGMIGGLVEGGLSKVPAF